MIIRNSTYINFIVIKRTCISKYKFHFKFLDTVFDMWLLLFVIGVVNPPKNSHTSVRSRVRIQNIIFSIIIPHVSIELSLIDFFFIDEMI